MSERLPVKKTYKLFIGGAFPRSESGRFYAVKSEGGELLANACRGSRKDLRNAVQVARKALSYATVEVCGCHAQGVVKDIAGKLIDSFKLADCATPCGGPAIRERTGSESSGCTWRPCGRRRIRQTIE